MSGKLTLFFGSILLLSACINTPQADLRIATAANLQFAMPELVQAFTDSTGITCEIVTSSSGKLTAHILAGAPFDLFLSADLKYPDTLYQEGFTHQPPATYARGQLVLWTCNKDFDLSLSLLEQDQIRHIALANPKTAPYGLAAWQALDHFQLLEKIEPKLVYGENISVTNHFIYSGVAPVGFTAKSVVVSPEMKGRGSWEEIDPNAYSPIQQGVVILRKDKQAMIDPKAEAFFNFLFSPWAQKTLSGFGYIPANK